jgi:hypothetical protein
MNNTKTATAAKKADKKETAKNLKVVKPEPTQPQPKAIGEKIQTIKQQFELVRQREDLENYKENLESFKFGADSFRQELEISDGERTFKTTKTEHLEIVVTELLKLVDKRIQEVENQIK